MSVVSRATGRSAVAAAAYRCAERLENARDGQVHDYTRKEGVTHAEIVVPEGVEAVWAKDRSALWNAAEAAEKRSDARVAREFVVALPHELSAEARTALTRSFAQDLANRTGAAVDFAIHAPHPQGDVRNHHAHLLMTTRRVEADGLGAKTVMELANKQLQPLGLPTTQAQLVGVRRAWEGLANAALAREGHDVQIDHRSHAERGLTIQPTQHMGVAATGMQRRGGDVERARLDPVSAARNAAVIRERPEEVLAIITGEKSVFDRRDIARVLHRYIDDDVQSFQNALASVMASPALVELQPERTDAVTGEVSPARYSTQEMVAVERGMAEAVERLHGALSHGVDRHHVVRAMAAQDRAIRDSTGDAAAGLSAEQRQAIHHITGAEGIAAVVGFAGAGKSTMLQAAREAWEAQGYRVQGAALSGNAAEGLEESSGIPSRTLASWSRGWDNDHDKLGAGDVLVIDEAGMVGSRQLARFVSAAEERGAKLVLVGDHEQLQAIGAGAPFRAVAERIGHAELADIRRQRTEWQRVASQAFATHRTGDGLSAYREAGDIRFTENRDAARTAIVQDYLADRDSRPEGTRVAMAHRRSDVRALNAEIRSALQDRGALARGEEAGERSYETNDGVRAFAPGDRIVFLENSRVLGVKNGMLGTVERTEEGRIVAQLDGAGRDGAGRQVSVPVGDYTAFDHGYATTIHKTQGATVDRSFVLASETMDRHLAYVAMTRHRDGVRLYADRESFADRASGRLVAHGSAPFEHKPDNRPSYFVTVEDRTGARHTRWGLDLKRAMREAKPAIGATIRLVRTESVPVSRGDGATIARQGWAVRQGDDLTYAGLEARLSRSGAKETVLDYAQAFAERRGLAEELGLRSEIVVPRQPERVDAAREAPMAERSAAPPRPGLFDGLVLKRSTPAPTLQSEPGPHRETVAPAAIPAAETPRRSMFDGLKLGGLRQAALPAAPRSAPTPEERLADRLQPLSPFGEALERYARAHSAAERQTAAGLPLLEAHKRDLDGAGQALDAARPGSQALVRSMLVHDAEAKRAVQDLSGRERLAQLAAGVERERVALADPAVRADRFVTRWQDLAAERETLARRPQAEARNAFEGRMRAFGEDLKADPAAHAVLRQRAEVQERDLTQRQQPEAQMARALKQGLEQSRGQRMR